MRTRILRRAVTATSLVIMGFAVASCSALNSVSKDDFKKELDDAGLGSTVDTQCLVDKLEDSGFKFRKYGELGDTDQQKITDATTACLTFDTNIPLPTSITLPTQ